MLLGLLLACASPPAAPPAPAPTPASARSTSTPEAAPNFLVLMPDSLRADRLDATRDGEPVLPTVRGLAARGVTFSSFISNSGWTLPAIAAFMSGTWPLVPSAEGGASLRWMRTDVQTLPEILTIEGYRTVVFWGNTMPVADPEMGRGFADIEGSPDPEPDAAAVPVRWLRDHPKEPFFAVVHDEDFQFLRPADGSADTGRGTEINQRYTDLAASLGAAAATDATIADYDHTAHRFDAAMGRVLAELDAQGLADHTVVIVTSNHGVDFNVHGGFLHGTHFDSALRVPFVWMDPRQPSGGRSDALVQTIDVAPTVLARAHVPLSASFTGTDLSALLANPRMELADRLLFGFCSDKNFSVRSRTRKLVHLLGQGGATGPAFLQYDLVADPDERTPGPVDPTLRSALEAFRSARLAQKETSSAADDAALRKALQERGYWDNVSDTPAPRSLDAARAGAGPVGPPRPPPAAPGAPASGAAEPPRGPPDRGDPSHR